MKIFIIIVLTGYLFYSLKIQIKIIEDKCFTRTQKIINSILLWIIPFLWGFIIKSIISTDVSRKGNLKEKNFDDNWWFLTGGSTGDNGLTDSSSNGGFDF